MRERGAVMAVRARVCPDGPRSVSPGILLAGLPPPPRACPGAGAGFALPPGRAGGPGTLRVSAWAAEELERASFGRGGGKGGACSCRPGPRPQFGACRRNRSFSAPCFEAVS